jgi:hypothetical protein
VVAVGLAVLTGCRLTEPAGDGAATATTATPRQLASFTVAAPGDVLIHQEERW